MLSLLSLLPLLLPPLAAVATDAISDACTRLRPCANGGVCKPVGSGDYACQCPNGWEGRNCTKLFDDCLTSPCLNNATCINMENRRYRCQCAFGFVGRNCEFADPCSRSKCHPGSECQFDFNSPGLFACKCQPGHRGRLCDVTENECQRRPCSNNGTCINTNESFRCECRPGYTGGLCETEMDPCSPDSCNGNGVCIKKSGTEFSCVCHTGYYGNRCENVCPCTNGAECIATDNGGYKCRCKHGFHGGHCTESHNSCTSSTCSSEGSVGCQSTKAGPRCVCRCNFTGADCGSRRTPCDSVTCRNGGRCRHRPDGTTNCACQHGFEGEWCEIPVDACFPNPCLQGECVGHLGSFECRCPNGFAGVLCDSPAATTIDNGKLDCLTNCSRLGGRCKLGEDGGERCECLPGFTGRYCTGRLDPCQSGVCPHPLTCEYNATAAGGFSCVCRRPGGCDCPDGWVGQRCSLRQPADGCLTGRTEFSSTAAPPDCPAVGCPTSCQSKLGDGQCNLDCNSRACLFDGGDCHADAGCEYQSFCRRRAADGLCDSSCDTAGCWYDGGDCLTVSSAKPIGRLRLRLRASANWRSLGVRLTRLIGAVVVPSRPPSAAGIDDDGVVVSEWRMFDCHRPDCFQSAESAAEATNLALCQGYFHDYGLLNASVGAVQPSDSGTQSGRASLMVPAAVGTTCLLTSALLFVFVLLACGVVKRRRESAPVWFPPGFRPLTAQQRQQQQMDETDSNDGLVTPAKRSRFEGDFCHRKWSLGSCHSRPAATTTTTTTTTTAAAAAIAAGKTRCWQSVQCDTPLHTVISAGPAVESPGGGSDPAADMIGQLLDSGFSPNATAEPWQETPLHLAARYCRADAAQALLDGGADPNTLDMCGRTALHVAIASGARGVCHLLMRDRRTDLNASTFDGLTPLMTSARYDDVEMAGALAADPQVDADAGDSAGRTALHWAAAVNASEVASLLLQRGANKDSQDNRERTPLFVAALEGSYATLVVLLRAGASRDACDSAQRTPSDVARARLHMDILQVLLEYRTLPDTVDNMTDRRQQQQQQQQQMSDNQSNALSDPSQQEVPHFPTPPSNSESPPTRPPPPPPPPPLRPAPAAFLTPSPDSPGEFSPCSNQIFHQQHQHQHQHQHRIFASQQCQTAPDTSVGLREFCFDQDAIYV